MLYLSSTPGLATVKIATKMVTKIATIAHGPALASGHTQLSYTGVK